MSWPLGTNDLKQRKKVSNKKETCSCLLRHEKLNKLNDRTRPQINGSIRKTENPISGNAHYPLEEHYPTPETTSTETSLAVRHGDGRHTSPTP